MGDKYFSEDTEYVPAPSDDEEPEASYDAGQYNYRIVNHTADIIALFTKKEHRDFVLAWINNPEVTFPE